MDNVSSTYHALSYPDFATETAQYGIAFKIASDLTCVKC